MQKKQMLFKTKGMNRDLSVSAFNPEFSFENRNLRLSTNESNTLLSWVNEKGTKLVESKDTEIDIFPWMTDEEWEEYHEEHPEASRTTDTISGTPLGTAVINHQLVLFTKASDADRIYVLTYDKDYDADLENLKKEVKGSCIFKGNLNFDLEHPIESLVSFEAEEIQKVYWVDGKNQPRIINIKASADKMKIWNEFEGLATFFDFNPSVTLSGNISVERDNSIGMFAHGVIQYAFCYLNMYSQQSNIIGISPLYYISPSDRGAAPDERVTCSFEITISSATTDKNYNYIRLFSIQRTSVDGTPIVKHLIDISLKEAEDGQNIFYRDTGINGETMDSTALLFMSKRPISAETIADKDNTLFLGNITDLTEPTDDIQAYFDKCREGATGYPVISIDSDYKEPILLEDSTNTIYKNTFGLDKSQRKISTLKGGETYRLGFQLKDKYGTWSNPIFIDDYDNKKYPLVQLVDGIYKYRLVEAHINLPLAFFDTLEIDHNKYTEIRPVIVHPTEADRKVLYQGVLNPTVFQAAARYNRVTVGTTSQSSWFFRPMTNKTKDNNKLGDFTTFEHYSSLPPMYLTENPYTYTEKTEIFGAINTFDSAYSTNRPETAYVNSHNTQFFVDQSIVTLNSPDIELAEEAVSIPEDLKLRIVGAVPITASASYTYVESSNKEVEDTTELTPNYTINNISQYGGQRLISDFLWQDSMMQNIDYSTAGIDPNTGRFKATGEWLDNSIPGVKLDYESDPKPNSRITKFMVNPWHATRPLNNDWEYGTTMLKKKIETTQLFSHFSEYFGDYNPGDSTLFKNYDNITVGLYKDINQNLQLLKAQSEGIEKAFSYAGYLDVALLNNDNRKPVVDCKMEDRTKDVIYYDDNVDLRLQVAEVTWGAGGARANNLISMKYNSVNHAIIAFNASTKDPQEQPIPIIQQEIPILPCLSLPNSININYYNTYNGGLQLFETFWGDTMRFKQASVVYDSNPMFSNYAFLWLGELYRENTNEFGGTSISALKANTWLIGGAASKLHNSDGSLPTWTSLRWTNGDTFFQRYDCLKTFPLTDEDVNQNSEILSFMCETRINLDGRYDKLRGVSRSVLPLIDHTNINKINPVYSQKDNYFTSRVFQQEDITSQHYPNYIAYSRTKESGSDVDTYTDISLASVLELDGDKGEISALRKLNNHIFAFQDSGISRVMFNDNVQVQSTEGVPIQIANSGKVLGKDYISNTVGCSNKWSIVQTPNGLYFMDSNDKSIYLFNGQLENISSKYGFNTWCKQHIPSQNKKWFPADFTKTVDGQTIQMYGFQNFRGFYDKLNQEMLYVNKEEALAWNEKLGTFTSFYDYGNTPYFENLDDVGLWIKSTSIGCSLWRHQAGEYNQFFGVNKPYWMTLVGNPDPQMDKIFTNLEFRACVDGDGALVSETGKFIPTLPFDSLETWNEYQHGYTALGNKNGHDLFKHGGNDSALIRKFRIWRCDIPRNNMNTTYKQDRMRNPWLYLKLMKEQDTNKRTEVHDVVMTYFE